MIDILIAVLRVIAHSCVIRGEFLLNRLTTKIRMRYSYHSFCFG